MKLISCQNGRILTSLKSEEQMISTGKVITTGFPALDQIAPEKGLVSGAIHELLCESDHGEPRFFPLMLAQSPSLAGAMVWCDPHRDIYPPAMASAGIPMDRLYLLQPEKRQDLVWAITECLRCRGVGMTIAAIDQLSRIEARRLQLAAERGGGIGLLFRSMVSVRGQLQPPPVYAAATRWLIKPMPGERMTQRWSMQLIYGHGGQVGSNIILGHCRWTHRITAIKKPADPGVETAQTA